MRGGVYIRDFGQVQYSEGMFFPPDSSCEVCDTADCRRMVDHCHKHGWVRGVVCNRCNQVLRGVDRGLRAASRYTGHWHNCLDCCKIGWPPAPPCWNCRDGLVWLAAVARMGKCPVCRGAGRLIEEGAS